MKKVNAEDLGERISYYIWEVSGSSPVDEFRLALGNVERYLEENETINKRELEKVKQWLKEKIDELTEE